jgi:hypothetical protein
MLFFLDEDKEYEDQEWMIKGLRDQFELARRVRATQQWIRYTSNWPIALRALRQLWETGRVSELKSPFWEPPQTPENK